MCIVIILPPTPFIWPANMFSLASGGCLATSSTSSSCCSSPCSFSLSYSSMASLPSLSARPTLRSLAAYLMASCEGQVTEVSNYRFTK
mgnify:CR=1 FL=1